MEDNYRFEKIDIKDTEKYEQVHKLRSIFKDWGYEKEYLMEDDEKADIFLLFIKEEPVATGRSVKTSEGYIIQNFATERSKQNQGLGRMLMKKMLDNICPILKKGEYVYLESMMHAVAFYEKIGFYTVGDKFLDDHSSWLIKMVYKPSSV